jgi:formate dehydrogenase iron-sulfur subunit
MGISRRSALKAIAMATGTAVARAVTPTDAHAYDRIEPTPDAVGMLYDTTKCIGCKACMTACNKANDLPFDTRESAGRWHMPTDLNEFCLNIIKSYRDDDLGEQSFIKRQCMHCVDPACTTACMLGALHKGKFGVVEYDADLCVGCRYCEMACPFNVPKFEWTSLAGKIKKCELCRHRLAEGKLPGCCEVCPVGAVIYGKRAELLAEAHRRIEAEPDRYVHHVYGEHEAGGTQVLYLSHVDFEKVGLPDYGDRPVPQTVKTIQHGIYQGMVAPAALYAVLAAVMLRNRKHEDDGEGRS